MPAQNERLDEAGGWGPANLPITIALTTLHEFRQAGESFFKKGEI